MSAPLISNKVLVMRFSALGDVAMTVPVVKAFLVQHPEKEVLMLSNQQFAGLFEDIDRLQFIGVDLKNKHKGLVGIFRIYQMLKKQHQFYAVADLHAVLRTFVLGFLLKLGKKKLAVLDKGRLEKFALTRKGAKIFRPLPHATERYMDVFKRLELGIDGQLEGGQADMEKKKGSKKVVEKIKIGFAPFAKHDAKMYSLDKFKEVVRHFDNDSFEIYFFGGGGAERRILNEWEGQFRHVIKKAEGISLKQELEIMKGLKLMVTMDSANMHLASLVGVQVVSIWGATHPYAGFYGYNQNPLNAVQVNLNCRPCSVFGNKPCWRGDHACMQQITTEMIIEKVEGLLIGNK
jgi:ADP-heptose:LPS heptosyltransferase